MNLDTSTWTEVDAAETDLALLPFGSTEQHGPHAPLSTDATIAEIVTEAGAEAYDGDVVIAPTLPYGVSEEHRDFAGTLWLRPDTFRDAVDDVVSSLAHHGFDRVVLVNGHGGNVDALREVSARISRRGEAYVVPFTWFHALVDPPEPMGHAGPLETALLRQHEPDLVREERIEAAREGASQRWGEWVSGTNLAHDSAEFTENGVVGDPAAGDDDLGDELSVEVGEALATLLGAVAEH